MDTRHQGRREDPAELERDSNGTAEPHGAAGERSTLSMEFPLCMRLSKHLPWASSAGAKVSRRESSAFVMRTAHGLSEQQVPFWAVAVPFASPSMPHRESFLRVGRGEPRHCSGPRHGSDCGWLAGETKQPGGAAGRLRCGGGAMAGCTAVHVFCRRCPAAAARSRLRRHLVPAR